MTNTGIMGTALVTGNSRGGLGETIAHVLDGEHYNVVVMPDDVCRLDVNHVHEWLKTRIKGTPLEQGLGTIINNFGINHLSWIGETSRADEEIYRLNVMLPYWIINWCVDNDIGPCRVVNIASQTYRVPQRCTALYAASKAALVQMSKVMARELASKGWVVNVLAPGKILGTDMTKKTDHQVRALRDWTQFDADEYAKMLIPMGRFTTTHEVARAVSNLLRMPDYVNGAVLDMMGGV
jgi:NAD(P)-dependent dehydrogenase (short-subunit alcohol dehydrogenase family)